MAHSSQPLVSVIVPCYNQAKFLSETLESIIAQTYRNWEAIIMDDGSPDDTEDVANVFVLRDGRIKYAKQLNQGVSAARNNAIRNYSKGTYILPLDADDIITSSYLEHAVEYLENHPECKLVYGLAEKFGVENGSWDLPPYDYQKLLFDNMLFVTSLFRRSDYDLTPGFNERMRDGVEDWDFFLSLLSPDDLVFRLNEVVLKYRIKKSSRNVVASRDDVMVPLRRIIYNNHKEIYKPYVEDIITYVRRCNATQTYIDRVNNSLSMKIGRMFTFPFGKIKDMFMSNK